MQSSKEAVIHNYCEISIKRGKPLCYTFMDKVDDPLSELPDSYSYDGTVIVVNIIVNSERDKIKVKLMAGDILVRNISVGINSRIIKKDINKFVKKLNKFVDNYTDDIHDILQSSNKDLTRLISKKTLRLTLNAHNIPIFS